MAIKKYSFIKDILQGKTLIRTSVNRHIATYAKDAKPPILDLGCGAHPAYHAYITERANIIKTDYIQKDGIDTVIDITKAFPIETESIETVFLFNVLYVTKTPEKSLKEIYRIMKPGGKLYLTNPMMHPEIPEPHDYMRLTKEGFESLLEDTGFKSVTVHRYGDRFSVTANILHAFFLFSVIRIVVYSLAKLLDRLIPQGMKKNHPAPLGYFCIAEK